MRPGVNFCGVPHRSEHVVALTRQLLLLLSCAEHAPHLFCKLGKNLGQNAVGSTVANSCKPSFSRSPASDSYSTWPIQGPAGPYTSFSWFPRPVGVNLEDGTTFLGILKRKTEASRIRRVSPEHPAVGNGPVLVDVVLDARGHVVDAKIKQGAVEALDAAALEAAMQWEFTPMYIKGVVVHSSATLRFLRVAGVTKLGSDDTNPTHPAATVWTIGDDFSPRPIP
jgi:TonB family protein